MADEKTPLQIQLKRIYDGQYDEDEVVKECLEAIVDLGERAELKYQLASRNVQVLECEVEKLKAEIDEWKKRYNEVTNEAVVLGGTAAAVAGNLPATPLKQLAGFDVKTPFEETPEKPESPFAGLQGFDVNPSIAEDADVEVLPKPVVARRIELGVAAIETQPPEVEILESEMQMTEGWPYTYSPPALSQDSQMIGVVEEGVVEEVVDQVNDEGDGDGNAVWLTSQNLKRSAEGAMRESLPRDAKKRPPGN
jgi:hypothetical protein